MTSNVASWKEEVKKNKKKKLKTSCQPRDESWELGAVRPPASHRPASSSRQQRSAGRGWCSTDTSGGEGEEEVVHLDQSSSLGRRLRLVRAAGRAPNRLAGQAERDKTERASERCRTHITSSSATPTPPPPNRQAHEPETCRVFARGEKRKKKERRGLRFRMEEGRRRVFILRDDTLEQRAGYFNRC